MKIDRTIYLSFPFKYESTSRYLYDLLTSHFQTGYKIRCPRLDIDTKHETFVWSDLDQLQRADILVAHIPEPSVGACSEFGMFKAWKPNNLVICYKCIDHSWLKKLSSYFIDNDEELITILEEYLFHLNY